MNPEGADQLYRKGLDYAYRLLAQRARTDYEVEQKLIQKGYGGVVDRIRDRLMALNLLDDTQYAKDFVAHCVRFKPMGRLRMRHELEKRGIARPTVEDVLHQTVDDELELVLAQEALSERVRKSATAVPRSLSQKEYRRLQGYLHRRGFPFGVVNRVMRQWTSS